MTPEFILTNDSEQLVGHDGPVVLLVSKRMVKSRNIAFALNALMTLTESAEMVRRFHGKLHFVVSGWLNRIKRSFGGRRHAGGQLYG